MSEHEHSCSTDYVDSTGSTLATVVIPAHNEAENLEPLLVEVHTSMGALAIPYEVLVVDDGSSDNSLDVLRSSKPTGPLRVVKMAARSGQSSALVAGVHSASGEWIITLDGDGQNNPDDIRHLWRVVTAYRGSRPILVSGFRTRRQEPFKRRLLSWTMNRLDSLVFGHQFMDKGCGLKIFRRSDFLKLPLFDHMHRFLPSLFAYNNAVIISVDTVHRARTKGASHYRTLKRFREGLIDMAFIKWLHRRRLVTCAVEVQSAD